MRGPSAYGQAVFVCYAVSGMGYACIDGQTAVKQGMDPEGGQDEPEAAESEGRLQRP